VREPSLATHRLVSFHHRAFFPQSISVSPLDNIGILSLTSNASLFGDVLLKMTFGPEYLVYALDYDGPLFAKGKWPDKRQKILAKR
jgi:hypothetical protein